MISGQIFPGRIALAENQVLFGFKTNEQLVSSGTKARIILYWNAVFGNVGAQFSLTFAGRTIVLTSALVPDGSGEQFRCSAFGDDNLSWPRKVAEDLAKNYYLSMLYDITYTYNEVIITAKNNGTDYNISGINISYPHMSIAPTQGTNDVLNPFYKVYLQIASGNKVLGEDFLPVGVNGVAIFDVGEYLRPEIQTKFAFPETVNQLMYLRNEGRLAYYARYGLFYGSEPKVKKLTNTAMFYALGGGVNKMTEGRYNSLGTSFYDQLQVNRQFLSWHPLKKRVQKEYMEKLYYICHAYLTKMNLKVNMNYIDTAGVNHTVMVDKGSMAANEYDLVEINCGYDRMQLALQLGLQDPSWTLLSYDVYLTDQNGRLISELRNYYFDLRRTGLDRTFLFRNSFKVWETFTARGVKATEPEYERLTINKINPLSFTNYHFSTSLEEATESNKQTVESYWVKEDVKRWLSELLLSPEVYEVVPSAGSGGILYPVVITSTNKNPIVDKENLHNVKIEYVHAFTDQHYSVEQGVIPINTGGGGTQVMTTLQVSAVHAINVNAGVHALPGGQ